jgi:hypothetical protein
MLQGFSNDGRGLLLLAVAGLGAWVLYWVLKNSFWHPLASFPGPRIAAITSLYRAYIDCVAQGSFVHTLERLHIQHGMS